MSFPVSIRPCLPDDLNQLMAMLNAAGIRRDGDDRAKLAAQMAFDAQSVLIAEHQGLIIGCIVMIFSPALTTLCELVVDPAYRRRGIAAQLVSTAERQAQERGTATVCAFIVESNHASRGVFASQGYVTHSDRMVIVGKRQ